MSANSAGSPSDDVVEARQDENSQESDEKTFGDPWNEMNNENAQQQNNVRNQQRANVQEEVQTGVKKRGGDGQTETELDLTNAGGNNGNIAVPIKNLVNFAGKGRDVKERRQAAFGFAHFSTEKETANQIAQFKNNYGIDALLSLLDGNDNICRRYASLALGNLVSNPDIAEVCIEYGTLEAMLPLAIDQETDLETRRYCMLAVANMAADTSTHPVVLQSLDHIILLIDSADDEIQKCACLCLQNLASSPGIVLRLQDSIQPLVNVISITKGKRIPLPDTKLHACAALRGLCFADILRLKIINEGCLRAFLSIIDKPPSDHILVEIAAILCGFSSLYETHIDLIQPTVLNGIFLLAMGDIVESQQYSSTCIANLASNTANHQKLIDCNAIPNLLIMCDYHDPKVKSSSTRALSNFASDVSRHEALMKHENLLPTMIRVLNSSDSYNNMFSALFFAILSDNSDLHEELCTPQLIQPLFHLSIMPESMLQCRRYSLLALANLASHGQSHPFILSEIEIQLNAFFSIADIQTPRDFDKESLEYFGLLLSNLAQNVNSHELLAQPAVLTKILNLVDFTKQTNLSVTLNVVSFLLKLLSPNEDIQIRVCSMFLETLCVVLLVFVQPSYIDQILYPHSKTPSEDDDVQTHLHSPIDEEHTVRLQQLKSIDNTTSSIPTTPTTAKPNDIEQHDIISSLPEIRPGTAAHQAVMNASDSAIEELIFMVSAFVSQVTATKHIRIDSYSQLLWKKFVVPILGLMLHDSRHQDIQIHAINALANLRDIKVAIETMVYHIIPDTDNITILYLILRCVQSSCVDIHASALRLISGITANKTAANRLIKSHSVHLIAPFVRSPHTALRKYAFISLANYASHPNGVILLKDVNLIKCFLNVAIDESSDVEEMRAVLFALANASFHKENSKSIADSGILILKTLLDYVAIQDAMIWEYGALLLANVSEHLANHIMFSYHDIIQMVLLLAGNNQHPVSDTNDETGEDNTNHYKFQTATNTGASEVTLPGTSTHQCIINALKCLRNLCFAENHLNILMECNLLSYLNLFLVNFRKKLQFNQYSIEIDRQIASVIYNISSHEECIDYVTKYNLAFQATKLLMSNQIITRRNTARGLVNIASNIPSGPELFLTDEIFDYILNSLKFTEDLELYHCISLVLGYVLQSDSVQQGRLDPTTYSRHIKTMLNTDNRQVQLAALWATSTGSECLIQHSADMIRTIGKLAEPQLLSSNNIGARNVIARSAAGQRPSTVQSTRSGASLNSAPTATRMVSDDMMGTVITSDLKRQDFKRFGETLELIQTVRRRALLTLVNYSANRKNSRLIIDNCKNVIDIAFNLGKACDDFQVVLFNALLLSNLSANNCTSIHNSMVDSNDVAALDLYFGYTNESIQVYAIRTMQQLVATEKHARVVVIAERIIPLLCLIGAKENVPINREIAALFQLRIIIRCDSSF